MAFFRRWKFPGDDLGILQDKKTHILRNTCLVLIAAFLVFGYGLGVIIPPTIEPQIKIVIDKGATAEDIADTLKAHGIIRSKTLFVWGAYVGKLHDRLGAGRYLFSGPQSIFSVLGKLTGERKEVKVVFPEGSTVRDAKLLFGSAGIDLGSDFGGAVTSTAAVLNEIPKGKGIEGFLFPDTYRFYETAESIDVVQAMAENFEKKIQNLLPDIRKTGRSIYDIIILASIVEKEALYAEDKRIVAGILLRRLAINMPLQVDATLFYERGKTSADLSIEDLKTDSPYNTYTRKGLPPTPIGNPGLEAIEAVVRPAATSYVYYLSDRTGAMHYAKTFEEHKRNKALYLQ